MYCRNCGSEINELDTYCFNCGARQNVVANNQPPVFKTEKPKSVFKKAWFWVLIVVAVLSLFSTLSTIFNIISKVDFNNEYNSNNPFDYEDFFEDYNENFEYNFDFE